MSHTTEPVLDRWGLPQISSKNNCASTPPYLLLLLMAEDERRRLIEPYPSSMA
jgi:hypothetical protein